MEYLIKKFEFLECPACKSRFALRWDIFSHTNCQDCKALMELSKTRIPKLDDQEKLELQQNFHRRKFMEKFVR